MPVLQTWVHEYPPGVVPIPFDDWLNTLPPEEQQRYHIARARADAKRQKAIDEGRMIITNDGYVWKDESSLLMGKEQDDECMSFYDRFNAETGRTQIGIYKEVE